MGMAQTRVNITLDIRGEVCPFTLVKTRNRLAEMHAGQVLEVLCDYEPAARDTIPGFCELKGYPLTVVQEGELFRLYIQRTD